MAKMGSTIWGNGLLDGVKPGYAIDHAIRVAYGRRERRSLVFRQGSVRWFGMQKNPSVRLGCGTASWQGSVRWGRAAARRGVGVGTLWARPARWIAALALDPDSSLSPTDFLTSLRQAAAYAA